MIRVIGVKKTILIFLLALANALFAGLIYSYMIPENMRLSKEEKKLSGQVNTVRSDIDRMQVEFEQLDKQQGLFDALKADGFFNAQGRTIAKDVFKKIQDQSKVISAVATVDPGTIEENKEAQKSKHKVLVSPVKVKIKAFDDADIYRYIEIMDKTFPGHISIDHLTITRSKDVSAAVLRAIATGVNPELLEADMELSWRTMIPEDQVITEEEK
ncbi:MAG: hypothetical protein KDI13_03290 [Alphaproteobacteria bacterium]|nr:hypothetical protein [Alphaproteobacteria bacterium]